MVTPYIHLCLGVPSAQYLQQTVCHRQQAFQAQVRDTYRLLHQNLVLLNLLLQSDC
jgi:hypothetical protein